MYVLLLGQTSNIVDVDLTFLYNAVFSIINRFLNWHFELYGHTVYVYAIFGFVLLVAIFIQLLKLIAGVSFD